ncbi:MAG: hypothetical protein AUI15_30090 [Actinobacteria bacterium 13_2_20CM_2_66_6]|nr:MAG: hypothetical protein AUI15_30090 [Actinobacteria bacterium 13_2_20CM_2_66_6]
MGQAERMPRLTESEYRATMDPQPVAIGQDDEPPFDFWPYYNAIRTRTSTVTTSRRALLRTPG